MWESDWFRTLQITLAQPTRLGLKTHLLHQIERTRRSTVILVQLLDKPKNIIWKEHLSSLLAYFMYSSGAQILLHRKI